MVLPVKKQVWLVLAGALVFHVLLLSLHANNHPGPGLARLWLMDALVPLEKVTDSALDGAWRLWEGYIALVNVGVENEALRAENDRLRRDNDRLAEGGREAERLQRLLALTDSGVGRTEAARVIGRDPSRLKQTLTVDKGQAQGVVVDDAVIAPEGVVGRVIAAGRHSAVVQLLNDTQAAVGVLVGQTRVQAVFRGNGTRELELDYVDDDTNLQVGDALITSGLDGLYPKGLVVGAVTFVGDRRGLFKVVKARLQVDAGRLEEVLVVIEPAAPVPESPATEPAPQGPLPPK